MIACFISKDQLVSRAALPTPTCFFQGARSCWNCEESAKVCEHSLQVEPWPLGSSDSVCAKLWNTESRTDVRAGCQDPSCEAGCEASLLKSCWVCFLGGLENKASQILPSSVVQNMGFSASEKELVVGEAVQCARKIRSQEAPAVARCIVGAQWHSHPITLLWHRNRFEEAFRPARQY